MTLFELRLCQQRLEVSVKFSKGHRYVCPIMCAFVVLSFAEYCLLCGCIYFVWYVLFVILYWILFIGVVNCIGVVKP